MKTFLIFLYAGFVGAVMYGMGFRHGRAFERRLPKTLNLGGGESKVLSMDYTLVTNPLVKTVIVNLHSDDAYTLEPRK